MLKRYQHIVGGTFRVVDAIVIAGAWLASYYLRFYLPLLEVRKGFPAFETYASLTPLIMLLWSITFGAMNIYSSKRLLRRTHEVQLVLRAHLTAMLLFVALTYMFSDYKYSRAVIVYFGLVGGLGIITFRLFLRNLLRSLRRKGYNLRHVLVIGEGDAVHTLIQRLEKFLELGIRVQGVVTHENSISKQIAGKKVLGHFSELKNLIALHQPDRLLISLPRHQYAEMDRILSELKDEVLDIQLIPDVHEYVTLGCEIEDFDGLPIVNLNDSPLQGWGAYAKRLTDILVSGFALLFLAPVLILISVLIKLSSRGPVLYAQERMGLDGKTFQILKFRSMRMDAEVQVGAVWAKQKDDRRTPLGALLRATSLDELPQLWNILKGEMSLVGPRPERPVFVHQFRAEIPGYMLRHKVKAGLTGWAQVNGWRGNTSLARRIECDLYYIRNWSYLLDWKIIFLTFWKGFINKNAY